MNFSVVWPDFSGVVLPNDSKGVAGTDIDQDGDRDLLIMENSGNLVVLENQSTSTTKVQIQFPAEADLAGCRVNFLGKDAKRAFELNSGGSYLSQSDSRQLISLSTSEISKYDSVVIVWPNGSESKHEIPAATTELIIKKPTQ